MITRLKLSLALSTLALMAASCAPAASGDSAVTSSTPNPDKTFVIEEMGTFEEPWAAAFAPGTGVIFVTEMGGTIKGREPNGRAIFVTGVPNVDYGGQGGLGDIAFLPSEAADTLTARTIFLSWAEAGSGNTRGAVVGKGTLVCEEHQTCDIRGLTVIWRQAPKVTGRGHYSHRIAISPDEQHLFVSSGDRQKMQPAQDLGNNLGSIVRLTLDGQPAPGNPMGVGNEAVVNDPVTREIWSYGHRNVLGLAFDAQGRLWDLEHGPKGGDELNLVRAGANYGWPVVSDGVHYDGKAIPGHASRPDLAAPAIGWTPVIAPGNLMIYRGDMFAGWKGHALISGLKTEALIRVALDGETAREAARYPMGKRIRSVIEGPDGALWVLEDGENGRLLRLTPG
ncbi:PQQ-dependent sugar dehydrogenase [Qipengyuania marisflavi]|uniref:PQQ-dependent sugar dehydrogenase n=1 Tax=Qipengyuania marisflavi TaxID=2486356 RepID=A0A5S3P785_9SPHN|nr:PQQ-dependent sugar dehydrogenase [Qipengyuania marisflavi]TMM48882.1 PQQ-dependent sugar dehydrogenase [Qipengyuania marisflavi]